MNILKDFLTERTNGTTSSCKIEIKIEFIISVPLRFCGMSNNKFIDINDKNMFPDIPSSNIKVRGTINVGFDRIENNSGVSSLSYTSNIKTQPCRVITSGKTCPYGNKCNFAHSLEELVIDECLYKNRCNLVVGCGDGVYTNACHGNKKCSRLHSGETKESFHKRFGTLNIFPSFPEKTVVLDMKCTKLCKNAYETIFNNVETKCDIENCNYAHKLSELNLLTCSFSNDCRHVEKYEGYLYKNTNLKKICVRRHPEETSENLCHRRREYDVNLEKEEEEARKKEEASNV